MIYLMDIDGQSYLATFSFAENKATFTGALNAAGGLFKGSVEAAYSNVQIQAGTGLIGGGTLATTRALNIDKASAANLTAGTADKVLTTDVAKPALDLKLNKADIVMMTGTVADGATIPLPAGFTAAQCKWLVSSSEINPNWGNWDINEDGSHMQFKIQCSVDANRLVTAMLFVNDARSRIAGTADYLIIGMK